jgi:hypothetical protein
MSMALSRAAGAGDRPRLERDHDHDRQDHGLEHGGDRRVPGGAVALPGGQRTPSGSEAAGDEPTLKISTHTSALASNRRFTLGET